mgnify:CR=1 FL=1
MLFDRQYILTEDVVVEVRYRTETRTDSEGNDYDVEVPYNYYICFVTLENKNLSHLPVYLLSEDQMSRYAIYMATLGNRPDLFPGSEYVGKYTETPEGYEVPGEYLDDETFAAMLSEAQKYIGYPYVWGGSSPSTSFDCSGYVSWVINHSGWNVGRLGAQGLPAGNLRPGFFKYYSTQRPVDIATIPARRTTCLWPISTTTPASQWRASHSGHGASCGISTR